MYLKYHTEGFVLGSREFGESSKIFQIFTRDLGLIKASAKSVRCSGLKLKSGLEDYTYGRFTFINGRQGWKLTEALPQANFYFLFRRRINFLVYARFLSLLKKLLPAEEPNGVLFQEFRCDISVLFDEKMTQSLAKNLECLTILRILGHLGYLEKEPWLEFLDQELNLEVLNRFSPRKNSSILAINKSLKASQLI